MPSAPQPPAERFARLIDLLCRAVAARGVGVPLMALLWSRLRRMAGRFARLAARIRAGAPLVPRHRPAAPRPARPPPPRLPEGFAWLVRLVPQAAAGASQLQHLLAEPEMAALIAAAPQMGRILRPLCRMLGVRPPPGLRAPPPARAPAPASPAAAVVRALDTAPRAPPAMRRARPAKIPA